MKMKIKVQAGEWTTVKASQKEKSHQIEECRVDQHPFDIRARFDVRRMFDDRRISNRHHLEVSHQRSL